MTGASLLLFALLRLGRLMRYVSHAVMTGFLLGVAVVLVLDQLAPLLGVQTQGANALVKTWDLLRELPRIQWRTTLIGLLALAILLLMARMRTGNYASLVALIVATVAMFALQWQGVQTVADVSPIPRALPQLRLPELSLITMPLALAAMALAVVIAVQGAGVGQSVENPDGRRSNASRDLLAQCAANALAGAFSGIPAGGSVGQTALNVAVGARSRWATVLSGVWMLLIVLLFPNVIGWVPMTALAAVMVVAGWQAIDKEEARTIWRTGGNARLTLLATFFATLVLSVPMAVLAGVGLAFVAAIASAARDVQLRRLIPGENGTWSESDPPARLDEDAVVVLDVIGSVFFAGARTLQEALPTPGAASKPVVVLRLHGRPRVGATFIDVLDDYADDLKERGGRFYLSAWGRSCASN